MSQTKPNYRTPQSIPQAQFLFSSYISEHFKKAFIWGIHTVVDYSGQFVYEVELSDTRVLYHLKFNLDGGLLESREERMI